MQFLPGLLLQCQLSLCLVQDRPCRASACRLQVPAPKHTGERMGCILGELCLVPQFLQHPAVESFLHLQPVVQGLDPMSLHCALPETGT